MTPEDPASSCFAKPGHGYFGAPVLLFAWRRAGDGDGNLMDRLSFSHRQGFSLAVSFALTSRSPGFSRPGDFFLARRRRNLSGAASFSDWS